MHERLVYDEIVSHVLSDHLDDVLIDECLVYDVIIFLILADHYVHVFMSP